MAKKKSETAVSAAASTDKLPKIDDAAAMQAARIQEKVVAAKEQIVAAKAQDLKDAKNDLDVAVTKMRDIIRGSAQGKFFGEDVKAPKGEEDDS